MTAILKNIFENSIGISLLIVLLFALRSFVGKKYTAKWQYWVWVVITLRLLLPFDIAIPNLDPPVKITVPNPVVYVQDNAEQNDAAGNIQNNDSQQNVALPQDNNAQHIQGGNTVKVENSIYDSNIFTFTANIFRRSMLSMGDVLCFVWICGGMIILCTRLGGYFVARKALMMSAVPFDVDTTDIREKLHISAEVEIFSSYMVTTPVLTGIFNPKILVPENSTDDRYLQLALYHELVHFKRCDIGFKLLLFVVTCAYWYNPFIWLMNRLAMEDIELCCDETICNNLNNEGKSVYGESLLMFAAKKKEKLLYSTSFSNNKKTMANRIKNIFNTGTKGAGTLSLAFIVVFAMLSGVLVACSDAEKQNDENQPDSFGSYQIGPEDENAIKLIELYENCCVGKTYNPSDFSGSDSDKFDCIYYTYNPFVWGLLENTDNAQYKKEIEDTPGEYQYYIPTEDYRHIVSVLFEAECDIYEEYVDSFDGTSCVYDPRHIGLKTMYGDSFEPLLSVTGKTLMENGDAVYHFERRYNNEIIGYVDYTMMPVPQRDLPAMVAGFFDTENAVWGIKQVEYHRNIPQKETETIYISTPQELVDMSNDYAHNGSMYFNKKYVLTNDIDMAGVTNFAPIGRNHKYSYDGRDISESGFCSTFDGNGYAIKNLTINWDSVQYADEYTGFFRQISVNGVVKNLTLENLYINGTNGCGGFAGKISGRVDNCHINGRIDGVNGIGGFVNSIVGYPTTSITNCTADVDVFGESSIAGFAACSSYEGYEYMDVQYTVENCASYGSVNSSRIDGHYSNYHSNPNQIAGFVARATTGNFKNCHVQTPIVLNDTSNMVGAFAADVERATFDGCTYNLDTSGNWYLIGTFSAENSHGDYRGFDFTPLKKQQNP